VSERTVLIVDDHDVLRGLLRSQLRAWCPTLRILEASDGETAIARAKTEALDAVIMDISLPGMNGIEATRALKEMHPGIPVLILSVHELQAYRHDAAAAGADAYVAKRHLHGELRQALSELLDDVSVCRAGGSR